MTAEAKQATGQGTRKALVTSRGTEVWLLDRYGSVDVGSAVLTASSRLPSESLPMRSRARMITRLLLMLVAATLLVVATPHAADKSAPRIVVEYLTTEAIKILRSASLPGAEKRSRLEDLVYVHVDFPELSKLVLRPNVERFSPEELESFRHEFRRHLSTTYGKRINTYSDEVVTVISDQEVAGGWIVKTKILRGGYDDIPLNYRLHKVGDTWKIIDFIIEGVSLVDNFRSQFVEMFAKGGPGKVIGDLRQKNAEADLK